MEKQKNLSDKRVIKTRRAIINATAELMNQKPLEQITIKEIADAAMINRKTFYAHYNSVYDVLNDIENDIIDSLLTILDSTDFSAERLNPYPLFEQLSVLISHNSKLYHSLLQPSSHSHLLDKVKEVVKGSLMRQFEKYYHEDRTTPYYVLEFIASGLIAVYRQWFNEEEPEESLQELSRTAADLIFNGVNGIFQQKAKEQH